MLLLESFLVNSFTRGSMIAVVLLGVLILCYMMLKLKHQIDEVERKVDVVMIILDRAAAVGEEDVSK